MSIECNTCRRAAENSVELEHCPECMGPQEEELGNRYFECQNPETGEQETREWEHWDKWQAERKVGDIERSYPAAPGTGYWEHRITRITKDAYYGVLVGNAVRELEPWECV